MRNHALRLLMITPRFFPEMGGIETHVYEVGKRLVQNGVDLTVLTTDRSGELPQQEVMDGIKVHRVRAFPAQKDLYIAPAIANFIQNGGWDLIHIQGIHTFVPIFAMMAAKRAKIPFIVTFHTGGHSSAVRNRIRNLQWSALRPLLDSAHRLIGVSRFEAEAFQEQLQLPMQRFTVIPNGGRLPDLPADSIQPSDKPLIVSIGRLEKYKGHQRVISAMPELLKRYPNAQLEIIGAGPYEDELRAYITQLNLEDRVTIRAIPSPDRAEMARTISHATVVALLSDYEAHPIAVLEALALQRPVLVTETSGLQELADRGYVRSVSLTSDATAIAQGISLQITEPIFANGLSFPTWEGCVEQLIHIYRDARKAPLCVEI